MRTLDLVSALLISEVALILGISVPTVRRRLRDARDGKNWFPLPIGDGDGQRHKLVWDREAVLSYMKGTSQTASNLKFETASQRKKRNADALGILAKEFGVKVKSQREKK